MKEFKFVPKKESGFEGNIMVKVPKYKERMKLLRECNFKLDAEGNVGSGMEQFDSIDKLISITESNVSSVSLVYGEGDGACSIDSIEELGYYQEGVELITELGNLILSGFALGKKSSKS